MEAKIALANFIFAIPIHSAIFSCNKRAFTDLIFANERENHETTALEKYHLYGNRPVRIKVTYYHV